MLQGAARTSSASSTASRSGCLSPGNNLREPNSYDLRAQLSRLQSEHEHLSYYWHEAEKKVSLLENEVLRLKMDADKKLQNFIDVTGSYAELKEAYGEANRRMIKLREDLRQTQSRLLQSVASSNLFHQKLQELVSQTETKFSTLKREASVIISFLLSNVEIQLVRKKLSTNSMSASIKRALEAVISAESLRQADGKSSVLPRPSDDPSRADSSGATGRRLAVPTGAESSTAASTASNDCGSSLRINPKQHSKRKNTENDLQSTKPPLTLFDKPKSPTEVSRCTRRPERPDLHYECIQPSVTKSRKTSHRTRSRRREEQGSVRAPVARWVDEPYEIGRVNVEGSGTGRGKPSRKGIPLSPLEVLFSRPGLVNSDETGLEALGIEKLYMLSAQIRRELDRRGGPTRAKVIRSPRSQAVAESLRKSLLIQSGRPSSTEQQLTNTTATLLSDAGVHHVVSVPYNGMNHIGRIPNRLEQPTVLLEAIERLPYKTREKERSGTRILGPDLQKLDTVTSDAKGPEQPAARKPLRVGRLGLSIPSEITSAAGPNRERRNARNMSRTRPKRDASRIAASNEGVVNSHRSALERSKRAMKGSKVEGTKTGPSEVTPLEKITDAVVVASTRVGTERKATDKARQEIRPDCFERTDDRPMDFSGQETNRTRKALTRQAADRVATGGPIKWQTTAAASRRHRRRSNSSDNSRSDHEPTAHPRALVSEQPVGFRGRTETTKSPPRTGSESEVLNDFKPGEIDLTPALMLRGNLVDGPRQESGGAIVEDVDEAQVTGTRQRGSARLSTKGIGGAAGDGMRPGVQRHVTCPNPKTSKAIRGPSSLGSSFRLEDGRNPVLASQKHRVLHFGTHERGATEIPGLSSARIPSAKSHFNDAADGVDVGTSKQRNAGKNVLDSTRSQALGLSPLAVPTQSDQSSWPSGAFDDVTLRTRGSAWLRPSNPPQRTSNSGVERLSDIKPSIDHNVASAFIPLNRSLTGNSVGRPLAGNGISAISTALRSSGGGPNGTWPTRHSVAATAGSSSIVNGNVPQLVYFSQEDGSRPHGQSLSPRVDLPHTNSMEIDPGTTPSARSTTARVDGDTSAPSPKSPSGKPKGAARPSTSTGFSVLKSLQQHQHPSSLQSKQNQPNQFFPFESRLGILNGSQSGCVVPLRGSGGGSISGGMQHDARASMPVPTVWSTATKLTGFIDAGRVSETSRMNEAARPSDSGRFTTQQYLGYKLGRSIQDNGAEDGRILQPYSVIDPKLSGNDLGNDFFNGPSSELEYAECGGNGIQFYANEFQTQRTRQSDLVDQLSTTVSSSQGNPSTFVHGSFQAVRSGLTRIRPADSAFHLMSIPLHGNCSADLATTTTTTSARRRTDSGRDNGSVPAVLPFNGTEQESRASTTLYDSNYGINSNGVNQVIVGPSSMSHNSPKNNREESLPIPPLNVRSTEAAPRRDGRLVTGPGDGRDRRGRISSAHPPQRNEVIKSGKGAAQRASHSLAPRQQLPQRRGRQNDASPRRLAQCMPPDAGHSAGRHIVDFSY